MNIQEYEELRKGCNFKPAEINIRDAQFYISGKEGTLLWGYTCDRDSFHVYIKDDEIHRVIYSGPNGHLIDHIHGESLKAEDLYPNKRTYPEATSFDFMVALQKAGEQPTMTTFNEKREFSIWYGKTHEDFEGKGKIVFKNLR